MKQREMEFCRRKAEVIKALAHPLRLAVVEFLRDGERCVCEIVEQLDSGQPNVSHHLALMVRAGVLTSRKDGQWVYYTLGCSCITDFVDCLDDVIKEQARSTRALLRRR